jgi:transcriptional regulator with XRE-family HTH domain
MTEQTNSGYNDFLVTMGDKLRTARILRGKTQSEAARDTGMSQSYLSAVESGKRQACTEQVVTLIKYYGIPYESVFGEITPPDNRRESPAEKAFADGCVNLLYTLASCSGSHALEDGAHNYIKVCAYILLRTLYRENPRNSEKIFSIDFDTALAASREVIERTPYDISMLIKHSGNSINVRKLEIPVEMSPRLRTFIRECEGYLIDTTKSGDDT